MIESAWKAEPTLPALQPATNTVAGLGNSRYARVRAARALKNPFWCTRCGPYLTMRCPCGRLRCTTGCRRPSSRGRGCRRASARGCRRRSVTDRRTRSHGRRTTRFRARKSLGRSSRPLLERRRGASSDRPGESRRRTRHLGRSVSPLQARCAASRRVQPGGLRSRERCSQRGRGRGERAPESGSASNSPTKNAKSR